MNYVYLTVFAVYIVIVVVASFIFREKRDESEFWTEGRSISGLKAGISLSATFMSISWSVVYGIEVFLQQGLAGFFILSMPWLIVLLIFFYLAPKLRDIKVFSQPELIKEKFGENAGKLAALPILFVFIIWGGAEADAAASILATVTGLSQPVLLVIIFLTISIYMSFSGTNAVILTDVIQYVLVALFFIIIYLAGFGNGSVNKEIFNLSLTKVNFLFIFLTLLAYLPGWLAETDIWIRLQVTKNGKEARKAMGIAILNSVLFVFLMPLLVASVVKPHITSGVSAVSYLLSLISHPIVAALAAIGLIAASMSTIDTCTNVAAMTVSYDLTKNKTNKKNIVSIWITGFASLLFAFYSNSLKDAFYLSSGLLSTSLFLPVLSCYLKKPSKAAVQFVLKFAPMVTIIFFILEKEQILFLKAGDGISYILFSLIFVFVGYITIFLNTKNK